MVDFEGKNPIPLLNGTGIATDQIQSWYLILDHIPETEIPESLDLS